MNIEGQQKTVNITQETIKRLLYSEMSRISEDCWCAGWLDGLEFALWESVLGGSRNYGMNRLSDHDVTSLKELSTACGGWYYWEEGASDAKFIPLTEWEKIYQSDRASTGK